MTLLSTMHLLIGNSFPLGLIRHPVRIEPRSLDDLRARVSKSQVHSFWGHANTAATAESIIGVTIFRPSERPVLTLSENRKPVLNGVEFDECWILSPDYEPGFRPKVGEEVPASAILDWQVLKLQWEN